MSVDPNATSGSVSAGDLLDTLCDQFERARRAGDNSPLENWLPVDRELRAAALVELARVDLQLRLAAGEPARAEEYLVRFRELAADPDRALQVVAAEFQQRRRREPYLGPDDYRSRFPQLLAHPGWARLFAGPEPSPDLGRPDVARQPAGAAPDAAPKDTPTSPNLATIPDQDGPSLPLQVRQGPAAVSPAAPVAPGARFQVLRPHARGGIGQVSLARDEELDREVALKEIQPQFADQPQFRGRFLQEARITGRLEHPGIVPVYGMGQKADGQPYYAMRFIKGQSLKEAIRHFHAPQIGKGDAGLHLLELRHLLNRFIVVCNTVAYAHSKGVIHRDLKPENIMLGPYGETLVVDWGLAKVIGQPEDASLIGNLVPPVPGVIQTEVGALVGTPSYMSPEQVAGKLELLGPASDVYSLGVTLYHLLTGKLPFEAPHLGLLLERVRSGRYPPPRQVDGRLPAALDAITRKAMALAPEARYASARDLADDLERFLADEPVGARPESWGEWLARLSRRYRGVTRAVAAGSAVSIVALIVALVAVIHARDTENRQHTMNDLNRDLADGCQVVEWTPEHRDWMDHLTRRLAAFDSAAAAEAQKRTNNACASVMEQALRAAVLEDRQRQLIADNIQWLDVCGSDQVQKLQALLKDRVPDWTNVFNLAPPFDNLAKVLDPQRVRREGAFLLARAPLAAADDPRPLVDTLVPSVGAVKLEATFAPSWSSASVLGLLLNHSGEQAYQFLVSVPNYKIGNEDPKLRLASLASFQEQGFRVKISLFRNKVLLHEQLVSLPPGPLRLEASRVGESLSFQVDRLEPLVFDDPFPLPARLGVFGVHWPATVGLERLEGSQQRLPQQPSPLEQGNDLFAQQDYRGALKFYQQQAIQAGARTVVGQEARYKQALACKDLNEPLEAERLWRDLMAELPTWRPPTEQKGLKQALAFLERGQNQQAQEQIQTLLTEQSGARADDRHRWPLLAACQLCVLYLQEEKMAQAEQILDRLTRVFRFEKLVALIPAEDRKPILEAFRLRSPRWGTPLVAARGDLEKINKAIQIEELIGESPYERWMTRWRLSDQYRVENNPDAALGVLTDLLKEELPLPERLALVRDLVWLLIELKKTDEALQRVEELLKTHASNPAVLPLRLEKARILAAQEHWEEAIKEVVDFHARADQQKLHYADWAEACLLLGFLLEHKGDLKGNLEKAQQEVWQKGLPRNFSRRPPHPTARRTFDGVADERANITLRCFGQLASLTGELSQQEADYIFRAATSTTGTLHRVAVTIGKSSFTPAFMHSVFREQWHTERGKDLARRITLRQISFNACTIELGQLILAQALHEIAYPGEPSPQGMEQLTWQGAGHIFQYYQAGKVDEDVSRDLLKIWKGNEEPLEIQKRWERVAPALEPDLRVPGAFALGRHFLVQGRLEIALPLLREVIRSKPEKRTLLEIQASTVGLLGSLLGQGPILSASVCYPGRADNLFQRHARGSLEKQVLIGVAASAVGQAGGLPNPWPVGWMAQTVIKAEKHNAGEPN